MAMSIIKVLSENLVNQIAAGEVVERPASVVKELVENSIDAGADKITIEVKDAGKTLIRISDNGKGMTKEDLKLAIQRHATSKIVDESDLWKISTMGFRGEALASIASVSKMNIRSKMENDIAGNEIKLEASSVISENEIGMSQGSQIEVENLFYNTPARQNYLKKDSTELSHISSTLNTIALANPSIAFKLIHNDKTVFDLPRVTDLISRISDVFGKSTADAMLPIFYGGSEFQLGGFIGKPLLSRSTTQHQYVFVNGRPIQHYLLANRIKAAYHSMLMENKKPVFLLNINIDPALIDVNVHPRKLEIRFEDQQTIVRVIYSAVKSALDKTNLIPKGFTESKNYMSDSFPKFEKKKSSDPFSFDTPRVSRPQNTVQEAIDFTANIMQRDHVEVEESRPAIKAITQISNSYIVAEDESGLVLIDQHAAHERVRYEELMDQYENQEKSIQPLLVPQEMELTNDEISLINDNKEIFEKLGFEIEEFGGKSFVIHAVPSCLSGEDLDTVIKGVLDDIKNQKTPSKMQGRIEEILTYMSCRSAIKFGQSLSSQEMQTLIDQTQKLKRPFTCPHGRPTMISLTLSELEKMFGRK